MNSKKAITLLVLASMILALVPVMPASAALTGLRCETIAAGAPTGTLVATGRYDQTFAVIGTGVTPGSTIEVYWDLVQAWDGKAGLLNSTTGKPAGNFEMFFSVPAAVQGDHYLWVKDTSTGETAQVLLGTGPDDYSFAVTPYIKVSPTSGLVDDTVTVSGYGFAATTDIDPAEAKFDAGGANEIVRVLTPATPKTSDVGSWTATFKVPTPATTYVDATYVVSMTDKAATPNTATANFVIGPAITLSSSAGPAGTVVTVTGRGYTPTQSVLAASGVSLATSGACHVVGGADTTVTAQGTFSLQFVVPSPATLGKQVLTVSDDAGTPKSATADFDINGKSSITVTPSYEAQLKTITVTGANFTKIADTTITVTIAVPEAGAPPAAWSTYTGDTTFKTDSNGGFTGSFTIPATGSGPSEVKAVAPATHKQTAVKSFRIGNMLVSCTPGHANAGEGATLNGFGFTASGAWNATLGGKTIVSSANAGAAGTISQAFTVPQLAPGTYEVYVYDIGADIGVTTSFTIDATTTGKTTPGVGPNGYVAKIEGQNFKEDGANTWSFKFWNSSKSKVLTVTPAGSGWAALNGNYSGTFAVPAAADFGLGDYFINMTDANGFVITLPFSIVSPTLDITPRKSEFAIGEVVNYDVAVSFAKDNSYVKIMDPAGNLFWKSSAWALADWIEVDTTFYYPYFKQVAEGGNLMQLGESAPLGTWTWKWYDAAHKLIDNGTFTVVAATADQVGQQVEDLNQEITDLADQLTGVTGEINSVKDDVSDVAAIAQQAVEAAQAAAEAVTAVAQTANTASQAADNAAEAAEAARDAASGLTTLVYGAIGAALVAALAAIVSLMQISRRIAG